MADLRKVFIVVAGGNIAAERHFEDTIQRKRTLSEVRKFLPQQEIRNLEDIYHGTPFIVWGAVPGTMNTPRWEKMRAGDIVLIYNKGAIRVVGEVAAKVRNKELARYFWHETGEGKTWELIYFIVNEEKVNVSLPKMNPLFGYKKEYRPQGFTMIKEDAVVAFAKHYGDIIGVLKTLEKGSKVLEIPEYHSAVSEKVLDEYIERAPTAHDEMQWRLIRLGKLSKHDVWIPPNDQSRQYDGHRFSEHVIPKFHETLDVPPTIKNIDVVWKFGPYSIKSAFEIEHSTSVYSGILRLSDLRAGNPNSNYPLFIVASEERRQKVINELRRPTFSGPCLRLNEVIKFLGYETVRGVDESLLGKEECDPNILLSAGEAIAGN